MARQVMGPRRKYFAIILLQGHSIKRTPKDLSFKDFYFKNRNNYQINISYNDLKY